MSGISSCRATILKDHLEASTMQADEAKASQSTWRVSCGCKAKEKEGKRECRASSQLIDLIYTLICSIAKTHRMQIYNTKYNGTRHDTWHFHGVIFLVVLKKIWIYTV